MWQECGGDSWMQAVVTGAEAASHTASAVRMQGEIDAAIMLPFFVVSHPVLHPWNSALPHSAWAFPPQANLPRASFTYIAIGVSLK